MGFIPSAGANGPTTYKPDKMSRSLDGVYVDGISVTLGVPCKTSMDFAVGYSDDGDAPPANCPCAKIPEPDPPTFVHNHYTTVSLLSLEILSQTVCTEGPLWGYLPENSCCYQSSMPWFYCQLLKAENGNIEVRMCRVQHFNDEDLTVEQIELYVQ